MSFYWIKTHLLIKAILSIHMGLSQYRKESVPHSMTDLLKSYRMGLEKLDQHSAKATFFCIGKNIEAYPSILKN
jgi:hypothetical protein